MHRRSAFAFLSAGFVAALLVSASAPAQEGTKNVLPYRDEQPVRAAHGEGFAAGYGDCGVPDRP